MTSMTEHERTTGPAPAETRPVGASGDAPRVRVMGDVAIALGLASMAPTGPTTRDVITRLRAHIEASLDDADRFVLTVARTTRRRYVISETIRHARDLIATPVDQGDPAARLRLHAKAADHLSQYAQAYRIRRDGL